MLLEQIIPEIRKGRRWRIKGEKDWRGPWNPKEKDSIARILHVSWKDLEEEFELEPVMKTVEEAWYEYNLNQQFNRAPMSCDFIAGFDAGVEAQQEFDLKK